MLVSEANCNAPSSSCLTLTSTLIAAHGAWLGWDSNRDAITSIIKDLNVTQFIRGFATNVANYNSVGLQCGRGVDCEFEAEVSILHSSPTFSNLPHPTRPSDAKGKLGPFLGDPCCDDPCGLLDQWNRANNELNYVTLLGETMRENIENFDPHFLIDSGRNGNPTARSTCGSWCNGELLRLDWALFVVRDGSRDSCRSFHTTHTFIHPQ